MEIIPYLRNILRLGVTILVVYVDDNIITTSDPEERTKLEQELMGEFGTKNLGLMMYFLGIDVAHFS